MHKALKSLCLC